MRAYQKLNWSGLDLSPLPYESSLSALWRVGWRNALSAVQLTRLCKGREKINNVMIRSFYSADWLDPVLFKKRTGWHLPQPEERVIFENLGNLISIWFSHALRICPICLGCGYHSVWFQFLPLKICPIHCCELSDHCQSCGEILNYEFSKKMLDNSYICPNCAQPISGIEVTLTAHCEFREHASEIRRSFRQFQNWIQNTKNRLLPLLHLLKQSLSGPKANVLAIYWCRPDCLLESIGNHLHPLPVDFYSPPYRNLTYLSWKNECEPPRPFSKSRWFDQGTSRNLRIKAYHETIRLLQSWILGKDICEVKDDVYLAPRFVKNRVIDVMAWEPKELAYMMLRNLHEKGESWGLYGSIGDVILNDEDPVLSPTEWCSSDLVCQALYIARYAGLFFTILKMRQKGKFDLKEIRLFTSHLTAHYFGVDENHCIGAVVFPEIPGLPIGSLSDKLKCGV